MPQATSIPFSRELQAYLKSDKPKTLAGLTQVSAEKSFAVAFLILMSVPALPIPTGGITSIFEIITILLALQLVIGRSTIWLPKAWLNRPLGKTLETKTLPYLIRKIRWLEKFSRPRLTGFLGHRESLRLIGLFVILFTLGSFVAPPFSGLDTIPALGVVIISLGLLLEDIAVFFVGLVVGTFGIILEISLAGAIVEAFRRFL